MVLRGTKADIRKAIDSTGGPQDHNNFDDLTVSSIFYMNDNDAAGGQAADRVGHLQSEDVVGRSGNVT